MRASSIGATGLSGDHLEDTCSIDGMPVVQQLASDPSAVDAERFEGSLHGQLQAHATQPCEFCAELSKDYKPGVSFTVQGPFGPIKVEPPANAKPGMSLRYRLAPKPVFRIQVPPGVKAGDAVKFNREDGIEVSVQVPTGTQPGETFEVTPPALMVKVPEGASAGDDLVFPGRRGSDGQPTEWFRARVPTGLEPNRYLTARLPGPDPQLARLSKRQELVSTLRGLAAGSTDLKIPDLKFLDLKIPELKIPPQVTKRPMDLLSDVLQKAKAKLHAVTAN
eukprot:CAMPEP_0172671782 /NCGR_PEP_ID=MMETSP1074-20121228/11130_1 /TAXON_ID=2916 /ORGANISM="Ceratium fusus, Strain PA161109" /LENGTH=277 /DNA_ID=CAMNT_0013488883 /DNA_START=1 /DNA_END=834 /DNA_ORIENTATION=+